MSKKNTSKKNSRREGQSAESATAAPEGGPIDLALADKEPQPRKWLSIPERMFVKSSSVYETASDILKKATERGAPVEVVVKLQNFMVEADSLRVTMRELVESGWLPAERKDMKELAEGDAVAVAADAREQYAWIPADVKLVVGQIVRSENGRIKSVLLKEEVGPDGVVEARVFGWAQLSHLTRR